MLALTLSCAPVAPDLLLSFLIGAVFVIVGMGLFTLGADSSMSPIGSKIGATLTKSKNITLIIIASFILGAAITIAEPDLQVLAETVPHINSTVLLITVGVGVGIFLAAAIARIIFGVRLRVLLIVFYAVVFLLAAFTDRDFLSIAFDSGGVTTGPMTVPFILALGVGVANIRSDRRAESDSFGLVALSSIGPILAVLILGFFYKSEDAETAVAVASFADTSLIGSAYVSEIPKYMMEMAAALAPIFVIFLIFQVFSFRLHLREFLKICLGVLFTYAGLVLFLTGVGVGFSPLGTVLGQKVASGWNKYLLVPLSMLLGWFIISAEPAVFVLEKQIEQISAGAIPAKAVKMSLSIAVSLAMGLGALRVITGISILWFLIPGYALAILLSLAVPDIYTAIAFDSGGVASGPMTATFMLQFMIGASAAFGGNILKDAFGVISLVAMMPLISLQLMGAIYGRKAKEHEIAPMDDNMEIIELWEA
ncbi:MAG: DUF1538 domain-containing protein [Eubacteriales bacterium]|nr:DUF1538 domain-containing protein [Eubacteriales bacterium]MDD3880947.1 DUF1538 domain-containing protein [Eubacteriales bacterium]MDD4511983.1 DUF1538 domain-containing protein [Eubacteriales bacterium]